MHVAARKEEPFVPIATACCLMSPCSLRAQPRSFLPDTQAQSLNSPVLSNMRLINTATLSLDEFFGDQVPEYVILSHTWQEEEVTFRDWADQASASRKKGYRKIVDTCELARKQGYGYVWVDTNCIDKSSSAELSEAINSMFSCYQGARICYVYLSDVPSPALGKPLDTEIFRGSKWFTRGWTLQELLAPRDVEFYSQDWSLLGTKLSLHPEISLITGIDAKYLGIKRPGVWYICPRSSAVLRSIDFVDIPVKNASIAERLSWVSNRSTTRPEDIAYCMLGILDLHMPLLYGEGHRAFLRLQKKIMKVSSDQSLFCWTWDRYYDRGSVLAPHPSAFSRSSHYVPRPGLRPSPYHFTNAGLTIELSLLSCLSPTTFLAILEAGCASCGSKIGLPFYGDHHAQRMYRQPNPPVPIQLCEGIVESQGARVFVSDSHQDSNTGFHKRGSPANHLGSCGLLRSGSSCSGLFLTFEPRKELVAITSNPPHMLDQDGSCLIIHPRLWEDDTGWSLRVESGPKSLFGSSRTGAALLQLTLMNGEEAFLVISSSRTSSSEGRPVHWRWHFWRVSPEEAAILQSPYATAGWPEVDRFEKALRDPNFARSIAFRPSQTHLSVSLAKHYTLVGAGAICHMHFSWFEYPILEAGVSLESDLSLEDDPSTDEYLTSD